MQSRHPRSTGLSGRASRAIIGRPCCTWRSSRRLGEDEGERAWPIVRLEFGLVPRLPGGPSPILGVRARLRGGGCRSEEHTSELQSLMRISYAVFCLKKKTKRQQDTPIR